MATIKQKIASGTGDHGTSLPRQGTARSARPAIEPSTQQAVRPSRSKSTSARRPAAGRRGHPPLDTNGPGQTTPSALQHTAAARQADQRSRLQPAFALSSPALAPSRPDGSQRSRRKRQVARTMRRFESVLARLPSASRHPQLQPAPVWLRTALVALTPLLLIVAALVYVHLDSRWFVYRDTVQINGLTYLDADELYAASGIDSWHILWLRPQTIRERLLQQPFVQAADVAIGWPNRVTIEVTEQLPVALWLTKEETFWLMPGGQALPVPDDRFNNLPQIIDPGREAQDVTIADRPAIDPSVLAGALALRTQLPAIGELRYNRDYGLNFSLPGGMAWVDRGDGKNLTGKFAYLEAIQQLIDGGKAQPEVVDVRFERPYFR